MPAPSHHDYWTVVQRGRRQLRPRDPTGIPSLVSLNCEPPTTMRRSNASVADPYRRDWEPRDPSPRGWGYHIRPTRGSRPPPAAPLPQTTTRTSTKPRRRTLATPPWSAPNGSAQTSARWDAVPAGTSLGSARPSPALPLPQRKPRPSGSFLVQPLATPLPTTSASGSTHALFQPLATPLPTTPASGSTRARLIFSPPADGVTPDTPTRRPTRHTKQDAVVDVKEHLEVYLRIRPFTTAESDSTESQSPETVLLKPPRNSSRLSDKSVPQTGQRFHFSKTSQLDLFDGTVKDLVRHVLEGGNSLVFTYGVTNAGKTFTFLGPDGDAGLLPRSLQLVFRSVEERLSPHMAVKPHRCREFSRLTREQQAEEALAKNTLLKQLKEGEKASASQLCSTSQNSSEGPSVLGSLLEDPVVLDVAPDTSFSIWVSFCEIYNENIHDLLDPGPPGAPRRAALRLSQDIKGNSFVKDLHWVQVNSAEEALKVMKLGRRNQSFAFTKLTVVQSQAVRLVALWLYPLTLSVSVSVCSHSIFSIRILRTDQAGVPRVDGISELSLCDLAGSERCAKTQNRGERLKEADVGRGCAGVRERVVSSALMSAKRVLQSSNSSGGSCNSSMESTGQPAQKKQRREAEPPRPKAPLSTAPVRRPPAASVSRAPRATGAATVAAAPSRGVKAGAGGAEAAAVTHLARPGQGRCQINGRQRGERLSNGAKPESVRPSPPPEMWSRTSHMLLAVAALHSKILSYVERLPGATHRIAMPTTGRQLSHPQRPEAETR
ncbi:unnamed protein product [Arctogadus glacialis]